MTRTIEELEELAISGDEAAARELELRYKELSAENRESDDAESEEYEESEGTDTVRDQDAGDSSETNDGSQAQNVTDAAAPHLCLIHIFLLFLKKQIAKLQDAYTLLTDPVRGITSMLPMDVP